MTSSFEPTTAKVKSTTSRKSKFRIFLFAALLLAIAAVTATCFFRLDYPYLSTEDAYVHGNQIFLTPRVTGTVVAINADDTDLVQKGQPLVVLDDSDAKVQLLQAEGALGDTMRKVCQLFVSVRQSKANVEARGIDLAKAEDDYRRRTSAQSGTVSAEDITHARQSADTARETLDAAEQQLAGAQALVVNSDLTHHPLVLQAEANVLDADLALQRTTIKAPETGYIVRRNVQVGQRVAPGTALLAIVPLNQIWVDANYKEQELRNVRIGQPVSLTSDFYRRSVKYKGRVVGLNPSTGAAFSLLPPDEGSGNWIKIIQRVPVRVVPEEQQLESFPLRVGLSMRTVIDTRDRSGEKLTKVSSAQSVYSTPIYSDEWSRANELMQSLVSTNLQALSSFADPPSPPTTVLRTRYYSGELLWVSLSTSKTMGVFPTPGSSGKSNGLNALAPERGAAVSLRDQQQPVFSRPFSLDLNRSPDKRFPNFRWLSGSKISPNSVAGSKRRKRKLGPHKRHDSNP